MSQRIILPLAVALSFVLAMVVPSLRLRVRANTWGVTLHRNRSQRATGAAMALGVLAILGFVLAYAWLGPAAVGVLTVPPWVPIVGWVMLGGGLSITVVAQAQMGRSWRIGIDERPTELVTHGLFAAVRNPIFSSMLLSLAGAVAIAPSAWSAAFLVAATVIISLQVRMEERHLMSLHGTAYARYAARVGRFIPGIGRL